MALATKDKETTASVYVYIRQSISMLQTDSLLFTMLTGSRVERGMSALTGGVAK